MVIDVGYLIIGALGIYVLAGLFVLTALPLGIWGVTWKLRRLREMDENQEEKREGQRALVSQGVGSPRPERKIH